MKTTYLCRMDMTNLDETEAEEKFLILGQGYTGGTLLDSTECQILLTTATSKSFMSKTHYFRCELLH